MPILRILKYPDPFLKEKAEPAAGVDDGVKALIRDMIETMYSARGIGLAAPQVGSSKRVIVLDVPDEPKGDEEANEGSDKKTAPQRGKNLIAIVNPEIISAEGSTTYEEGCLSLPGINADVDRYAKVAVKGLDREGAPIEVKAEGLFAIALQHEIDHLDGILFIDRLSRLKRGFLLRKYKKAMEEAEHAL